MSKPLTVGFLILIALAGGYWLAAHYDVLQLLENRQAFQAWINELGALGPAVIVLTMTFAIVFTPIPSAPVALISGATYGHFWGAIYVLAGAEAGALLAFLIARLLGYELLHRWLGDRLSTGLLGSQNGLMTTVFISRLLPFISFDLVSYAAGLTSLSYWRFALATLAGSIPASFLLAHFGSELATGDGSRIALTVLLLGAVPLILLVVTYLTKRRK